MSKREKKGERVISFSRTSARDYLHNSLSIIQSQGYLFHSLQESSICMGKYETSFPSIPPLPSRGIILILPLSYSLSFPPLTITLYTLLDLTLTRSSSRSFNQLGPFIPTPNPQFNCPQSNRRKHIHPSPETLMLLQ